MTDDLCARDLDKFGPSCPGCGHSPQMAHEPGCDVIAYIEDARRREVAALVSMLERRLNVATAREDVRGWAYEYVKDELEECIEEVNRGDHRAPATGKERC